jgi:hypothetical protein
MQINEPKKIAGHASYWEVNFDVNLKIGSRDVYHPCFVSESLGKRIAPINTLVGLS